MLHGDPIVVLGNRGINIGEFDTSIAKRFVILKLGPLLGEPFALGAGWVDECHHPDVIIVFHHGVIEVGGVEAKRICPETVVSRGDDRSPSRSTIATAIAIFESSANGLVTASEGASRPTATSRPAAVSVWRFPVLTT